MIRAQCLVHRQDRVLMVKHCFRGEEYWCLPGGGVEAGETPEQAALRELEEECCVRGKLCRQTSRYPNAEGADTITFLVDIGAQEPALGQDPEFCGRSPILVDLRWMELPQIPERDRAYLWAAGLISIPEFLEQVSSWGDEPSYPIRK